jgi:uncharacterized protein (DUF488 family)
VKILIDIRLNNDNQLAGFTKQDNLKFFLEKIGQIGYLHLKEFAPNKELFQKYKNNLINWSQYEKEYLIQLNQSRIWERFNPDILEGACFLCSEPTPEKCHRRLLAEFLANKYQKIQIIHL